MPKYEIYAARDGDTFRETIVAPDEGTAVLRAYSLIAHEFRLKKELEVAITEGDIESFEQELDGFTLEQTAGEKYPDSDAAVQIAEEAFRAGYEAAGGAEGDYWPAWCAFEPSEAAKELVR
jgi:hypothetical protein